MSYRHIANLYKDQTILAFRECWALEKIHGTSANIRYADGKVWLHSGGEKAERFAALFEVGRLLSSFEAIGHPTVIVYGEAYGGSQQKQSHRYGPSLKFAAFEVQVGESWLSVPSAHEVATKLWLEFVHYERCATDLEALNAQRDAPSVQASRNGMGDNHPREGVVLRPITEFRDHRDDRVICKHKRDDERETKTPREVVDVSRQTVLAEAEAIAEEWVTPTRLEHVLGKLDPNSGMERTRDVIAAMTEDVLREGAGEIVDGREARAAIGRATAILFKRRLQKSLEEAR